MTRPLMYGFRNRLETELSFEHYNTVSKLKAHEKPLTLQQRYSTLPMEIQLSGFTSNPNQTHLNQLIKVFKIAWKITGRCVEETNFAGQWKVHKTLCNIQILKHLQYITSIHYYNILQLHLLSNIAHGHQDNLSKLLKFDKINVLGWSFVADQK